MDKEIFINNELWALTISSSFQRANVYVNKEVKENLKEEFKAELRDLIESIAEPYFSQTFGEEKHLQNINSITIHKFHEKQLLRNEQLNFGVSQKLLNLHLKYHWCIGNIKNAPPHFPVDRQIQEKLGFKQDDIKPWTDMDGEHGKLQYIAVIEKAKSIQYQPRFNNIAELELFLFSTMEKVDLNNLNGLSNNKI